MLLKYDYKQLMKKILVYCHEKIVLVYLQLKLLTVQFARQGLAKKEQLVKAILPLFVIFFGIYACTASQKTIQKNIHEIFEISDQIREHYAEKPDYWGLSTSEVLQHKIVSEQYLRNGKIIISGDKTILVGQGKDADVVMPRSFSFDIIVPYLNKAQCMALAEAPLSAQDEMKLVQIQIINSSGIYTFEWGGEHKLPVQKYASKNLCLDKDNTLIWSVK